MADIALYLFPGACSRVTITALEQIGLPFEARILNLFGGQQKTPEMLAINPKGKVPALLIGDEMLTENAAILYYLHTQYPDANLLPPANAIGLNAGLQDLVWCSSTLHPTVRQIRMPVRFTSGDTEGVKANGIEAMSKILDGIAARLEKSNWWYGAQWSIVDVYLFWNYSTAESGGLNLTPWPAVLAHAERVREIPAFQRALAQETAAVAKMNAAQQS